MCCSMSSRVAEKVVEVVGVVDGWLAGRSDGDAGAVSEAGDVDMAAAAKLRCGLHECDGCGLSVN